MRSLKVAIISACAVLAAAPASAAVFNVANTGGPFSYAQYNGGSSFTAFTAGCTGRTDLPSCFEGPQGAGNSQLVYDAGSTLVAHPGTSATTAVLFTAPISSRYSFDITAALLDGAGPGTDGVSLLGYLSPFGAFSLGALTPPVGGPASSATFATTLFLTGGQQIGLIFGNNGNNNNDSVGLTGTVSPVPEPATWAMMIGGFGLVGATMRRRARQAAHVAYA